MDENFEEKHSHQDHESQTTDNVIEFNRNHPQSPQSYSDVNSPASKPEDLVNDDDKIKSYSMDDRGNIHSLKGNSAILGKTSRTYIILGWICAALTVLFSTYFAIPGILLGILASRQSEGSGRWVIITNVVLAAINILLGLILATNGVLQAY